jgi:arabinofuranosyltransferase
MNLKALPLAKDQAHEDARPASLAAVTTWAARYAYALVPAILSVILGVLFISSAYGTQDDDGYIFYQYARNIADGHGLSFNSGELSFGVTSGAWTFLLAGVHALLRADIILEAQLLGLILFALSAGLWAWAVARWTGKPGIGLLAAGAYVIELDGLKASLSGLEVGLNLAAFSAVACLLAGQKLDRPVLLGLACGLAFTTRPDSVVLFGAVFVVALLSKLAWKQMVQRLTLFGAAAMLVALPWYGWLWASSGSPVPPTQTGKLTVFLPMNLGITLPEYEELSVSGRLGFGLDAVVTFATGGSLPVLIAITGWLAVISLSAVLWFGRHTRKYAPWPSLLAGVLAMQILLYAYTFPLVKLRYLINLLPVGIVLSVASLGVLWMAYSSKLKLPVMNRAVRWVGVGGAAVVLLAGAYIYSRELQRQINNYAYSVQVQEVRNQIGRWLSANTPTESLVALEPIGSVTFYSGRRTLDMGGLIDKSTWPALRYGYNDGKAMAALIRERNADYLVEYTQPEGIGGVGKALPYLPGARRVAVISSPDAQSGRLAQYGSYSVYSLNGR